MKKGGSIQYTVVDISELMVEQARKLNKNWIERNQVRFYHTNGVTIPVNDQSFDTAFSINTI